MAHKEHAGDITEAELLACAICRGEIRPPESAAAITRPMGIVFGIDDLVPQATGLEDPGEPATSTFPDIQLPGPAHADCEVRDREARRRYAPAQEAA